MRRSPTDLPASRLWQRQRQLISSLKIPADALPGSLALAHRRCGKPSCHCADGEGHAYWSLTFMVAGKKRVESIPEPWIDAVRQRVESGRDFKEALAELWVLNAEQFVRERKQQRRQKRAAR